MNKVDKLRKASKGVTLWIPAPLVDTVRAMVHDHKLSELQAQLQALQHNPAPKVPEATQGTPSPAPKKYKQTSWPDLVDGDQGTNTHTPYGADVGARLKK